MRLTQVEIDELLATRTTHRNTFQNDAVTFLRTSAETGGEYTLVHLVAEPGAGVPRHYHLHSSEHFEVLEGALTVEVARQPHVVLPGEEATVPVNTVHRWMNQGSSTVRVLAEITPASEGFEKGLPILYGLAGSGRSTSQGVPRDPLVAAWIMELTDMRLPGISRVAGPVIHALAQSARARGVDRELEERYCR
ncbi:cupin domain-containing protein [Kocuria sediminis]|uniref:Cupin domain-containing protein n=1 Tax=Kocuria sediminis TaxID=1038857 RepID=A0A6N8GM54_9MICC|nr:cupin domain-containing protein [Kocuria sediminis]MUN63849.1 cupin domain-containing protein [Kocuria sediminis]